MPSDSFIKEHRADQTAPPTAQSRPTISLN
jgi:hypothetical protein